MDSGTLAWIFLGIVVLWKIVAFIEESWRPSRLLRLRRAKPGGGFRVLSIPTVEDRIVIEMLRRALDERRAIQTSPRNEFRGSTNKVPHYRSGLTFSTPAITIEFANDLAVDWHSHIECMMSVLAPPRSGRPHLTQNRDASMR